MKKRYTEEQIIKAIKQHEAGAKVDDICRDMGISSGTFYNWRSKYAGLEVNEAKRLRELESENNKLKKLLPALDSYCLPVITRPLHLHRTQHCNFLYKYTEVDGCR